MNKAALTSSASLQVSAELNRERQHFMKQGTLWVIRSVLPVLTESTGPAARGCTAALATAPVRLSSPSMPLPPPKRAPAWRACRPFAWEPEGKAAGADGAAGATASAEEPKIEPGMKLNVWCVALEPPQRCKQVQPVLCVASRRRRPRAALPRARRSCAHVRAHVLAWLPNPRHT